MNDKIHDPLVIAGREFKSRLIVGTSRYPDPHVMLDALAASGTELVTVSVRRVNLSDGSRESFLAMLRGKYSILPNTAGCTQRKKRCSPHTSRAKRSTPTG